MGSVGSFLKKSDEEKRLKQELYSSRHLAEILDSFEQMNKLIDSQEEELVNFLSNSGN
jgi:hypothetical protein